MLGFFTQNTAPIPFDYVLAGMNRTRYHWPEKNICMHYIGVWLQLIA